MPALLKRDAARVPRGCGSLSDRDCKEIGLFGFGAYHAQLRCEDDGSTGNNRESVWNAGFSVLPGWRSGMRTQQAGNDEDDREHTSCDEHGGDEPKRSQEAHPEANRGEQFDITASQGAGGKGEGAENQEKSEGHSVLPELCRKSSQGHCGQASHKNSEADDV